MNTLQLDAPRGILAAHIFSSFKPPASTNDPFNQNWVFNLLKWSRGQCWSGTKGSAALTSRP